ncbi:MAG: hypothetical protein LUH20_07465 [Lachnospiraceae bacterium]|nr:hypothetical protein [Lachnospiraceae bacterium]
MEWLAELAEHRLVKLAIVMEWLAVWAEVLPEDRDTVAWGSRVALRVRQG